MPKTLSVVIPVYNEEKTITRLLDKVSSVRLPDDNSLELLIVNDGSRDTSEIQIRDWLLRHPDSPAFSARLFSKANGGKGSAVRLGIQHSHGDAVIIQDADLEYDPADYASCAAPIFNGECKVVYGTREDANRNRIFSSPAFYLGALSLTLWINLLYNSNLTDEATCYKTFDGDLIRAIPFDGNHFEWEPEITAKLLRLGYEIREVPIRYFPRSTAEGKKIRFKDGIQGLWVALQWRFRPMRFFREKAARLSGEDARQIRTVRTAWIAVCSVFLLALAIRLFCAIPGLEHHELLLRPDSATYIGPARALLADGTFSSEPGAPPTAFRTPGYPLFLAFGFALAGGSLAGAIFLGILAGALTVFPLYWAARLYGGWKVGTFAALLFALNPTAIALSPILLSDTLFAFLAAFQLLFFMKFVRCKFALFFMASIFFAGLCTLVRPLNIAWILPALFVLFCIRDLPLRRKGWLAFFAVLLFALMIGPWILRNHAIGAGWRIDTVSALTLSHNVSALESRLNGIPGPELRAQYEADFEAMRRGAPDTGIAEDISRQETYFMKKIFAHPWTYFRLHFRPVVLVPDVPSLLEILGVTQTGRNTFDVLNREGFFAAVRHYFEGRFSVLLALSPMIFAVGVMYLFAFIRLATALFRREWMLLLLYLLFAQYYLFMPGPVAMPRYQIPALLFLTMPAAEVFAWLLAKRKKDRLSHGFFVK